MAHSRRQEKKLDFTSLENLSILITGGTGSFGQAMTRHLLAHSKARRIIIFSRDELKQWQMGQHAEFRDSRLRFFLGDVRDKERLTQAFQDVDLVIHAAALKQVPAAEYNPAEFIKTNVLGSLNVAEAAIAAEVPRVLFLSTDKAVSPINLYGASKLCAEKLVLAAGVYSHGDHGTRFSVMRYGNVMMSRGSVIELWKKQIAEKALSLPLTHIEMTRFWITLEQAVSYVRDAVADMQGGEIFVPRIPSMKLVELAKAMAPELTHQVTGIRPGEKLHEVLMNPHEAAYAFAEKTRFIIVPPLEGPDYLAKTRMWWQAKAIPLAIDFCFASNQNCETLTEGAMKQLLNQLT